MMKDNIQNDMSIIITVSPEKTKEDFLGTLLSIPWDTEITIIIYSEDSDKIRNYIDELKESSSIFRESLLESNVDIIICDSLDYNLGIYRNIAIQDCETEYITFIQAGDQIGNFDPEILYDNFSDFIIGSVSRKSGVDPKEITETSFSARILPLGIQGIIFSVDYLKKNNLGFDEKTSTDCLFLLRLFNIDNLNSSIYGYGWGKLTCGDLFSIYTDEVNISEEPKVITDCLDFWKNTENKKQYTRELIWNRISRASAYICESYWNHPDITKQYFKYLYPENIDEILV